MKRDAIGACAPRILLVEDDATSRAFLAGALAAMPARVAAAAGAGEALAIAASSDGFALWLVDARLPDADGAALLAALRLLAPATPALAHTASREPACVAALRAAGFDAVLHKPLGVAALHAAVRAALQARPRSVRTSAPAPRIEAAARRAMLRALFHAELPVQRAAIEEAIAAGDVAAARGVLHRLRASCGFVGAGALGAAVRALQSEPESLDALRRFGACVDAVLALAGGALA